MLKVVEFERLMNVNLNVVTKCFNVKQKMMVKTASLLHTNFNKLLPTSCNCICIYMFYTFQENTEI